MRALRLHEVLRVLDLGSVAIVNAVPRASCSVTASTIGGMGVAVDQRGHVVGEVDPLDALDIGDPAALAVIGVERVGLAQARCSGSRRRA